MKVSSMASRNRFVQALSASHQTYGEEIHKSGASMGFAWNIMDRHARLLSASKLSDQREETNAINACREAIASTQGLKQLRDDDEGLAEGLADRFSAISY